MCDLSVRWTINGPNSTACAPALSTPLEHQTRCSIIFPKPMAAPPPSPSTASQRQRRIGTAASVRTTIIGGRSRNGSGGGEGSSPMTCDSDEGQPWLPRNPSRSGASDNRQRPIFFHGRTTATGAGRGEALRRQRRDENQESNERANPVDGGDPASSTTRSRRPRAGNDAVNPSSAFASNQPSTTSSVDPAPTSHL
ncbi:hypothetical protein ACLOJK_028227 [Asimina triloba]